MKNASSNNLGYLVGVWPAVWLSKSFGEHRGCFGNDNVGVLLCCWSEARISIIS